MRLLKASLCCILVATASDLAAAQTHPETIKGRVRADSGQALQGARVILTRSPDRAVFEAVSGTDGSYAIRVTDGTGDYLLHVSAPGFASYRRRISRIGMTSAEDTLLADATLTHAAAQQLSTVAVRAAPSRARPSRDKETAAQIGAAESLVDGFASALPPENAGDLNTISASLPGITPTPNGISVLGLDPSQNSTTLNGMAFNASSVPRAAAQTTRVSTSTYDPTRGWFGGANTNVDFAGGGVFHLRSGYLTVDTPALQISDPVSRALGQRVTAGSASIGGSGPLDNRDRFFYSFGIQATRRISTLESLWSASSELLGHAGLSGDSVSKLHTATILAGLSDGSSSHVERTTDDYSFLLRLDHEPRSVQTLAPAKNAASVTLFASQNSTQPSLLTLNASPFSARKRSSSVAALQARWSSYLADNRLLSLRSSVSLASEDAVPYAAVPTATVLLASALQGEDAVYASVEVGGGAPASGTHRWTWENVGELQVFPRSHPAHRITVAADARFDAYATGISSASITAFEFNSLSAFETNQPSVFRSTTQGPARLGAVWNGFAAVGDVWKLSSSLRAQYGFRLEGNTYATVPDANPLVEHTFGVRNNVNPSTVHLSPRLGFTWTLRDAGNAGALRINKLGTFNLKPSKFVRFGIGEFRGFFPASLQSDAMTHTGLTGSTRAIKCLGDAVPKPMWVEYIRDPMTVPTNCALGRNSLTSVDTAPLVRLVDRGYTAPRSWRANVGYESRWNWLGFSLDATYSLNLNQSGRTDLNFADQPRFHAPDGRAIYATDGGIDPSTGIVSNVDARRSKMFGQAYVRQSDRRSISRQLIATIAPTFESVSSRWVQLSYALSSTQVWQNGFDGTTFGSPLKRTWERSPFDARHSFLLRGGVSTHGVTVTWFGRLSSGIPYTPVLNADVNGDGLANDRAFIPFAGLSDAISQRVDALVATSSPARACLAFQRGLAARGASCEGPWSASLNADVAFSPRSLAIGGRVPTMRLSLANSLAGIDQLVHGSSRLRGWGSTTRPDPVLYFVRGFDKNTGAFLVDVNSRFGSTAATQVLSRSPFRITVDVRFDFTPDIPRQQLARYLGPGRGGRPGPRLTAALLQQRYSREVADPYDAVLTESDSLLLSRTQIEALQSEKLVYRAVVDSAWKALATTFANFGERYDVGFAVHRQEQTIADVREITRISVRAKIGLILNSVQIALMPGSVLRLYRADKPLNSGGRTLFNR